MYEIFYKLQAEPFRLSPDHRFCFNHRSYAKAKSYMQYAFQRAEGFVMITGRPGTGKTTLVNDLIDSLSPSEVTVAMLVSTQLEANDLLRMVAYFFGLEEDLPHKAMIIQRLTRQLTSHYKEGRRALLIVDEAQDLSASALEELRLLTNLQLNSQPLLQIFLLGQEQLKDLVHGPNMEQVHQRLVAAYDLETLKEDETKQYIKHRLDQVGWKGDPAISEAVFPVIYKFSHGIPRRINLFCSRLFLHGSVEEKHKLGVKDAKIVIQELQLENLTPLTDLSDFDFNVPDKYESITRESDDSTIASKSPAPHEQQTTHSNHNEQTGPKAPTKKTDTPQKSTASRKSAAGKQKKQTNKEQHIKPAVSRGQDKSEAGHTDINSRISGQPETPHATEEEKQSPANELTAEIDALKIELDGLSNNVQTLLNKKNETEHPAQINSTPAKPRKKWVALVLLFTVGLSLIAVVLLSTTSRAVNTDKGSARVWMENISEKVRNLFTTGKVPDVRARKITAQPVLTSPVSTVQPGTEQRAVSEQVVKSTEQAKEIHPASEKARAAGITAIPEQNAAKDETAAPLDKIASQNNDDNSKQDNEEVLPDTLAVNSNETATDQEHPVKKIFFQFDSVDIEPDYYPELDELVGKLASSTDTSALIIGYSDSMGDKEYNRSLSLKRARAVASYMASQGLSFDRIRTDGKGILVSESAPESGPGKGDPDRGRMVEIYFIPSIN